MPSENTLEQMAVIVWVMAAHMEPEQLLASCEQLETMLVSHHAEGRAIIAALRLDAQKRLTPSPQ